MDDSKERSRTLEEAEIFVNVRGVAKEEDDDEHTDTPTYRQLKK